MVFSPEKFNFARETVEFAGFVITSEGIKPTDRYIESIRNFPTPNNISEVRAWFGLINLVNIRPKKFSENSLPYFTLLSQTKLN